MLIAENEQQAGEISVDETNKKWSRNGGRPREWTVAILEARVEGPPAFLIAGTAKRETFLPLSAYLPRLPRCSRQQHSSDNH